MIADLENTYQVRIQTIFIADDDSDDELLFRHALSEVDASIKLEATKDGNELLSLLQNFKPDMLFLDLDMPAKNGLECLKALRSNPVYTDLPIIVFSSTSRKANIDVAYEMGANLFFIKPSFYKDLVGTLQTILKLNWAQPSQIKEQFYRNGNYLPINITTTEKEEM